MRLDEYLDGVERDTDAERRRLAEEKSYAIVDHLDEVERQFENALSGGDLYGSTAPEIFVGRSAYPEVSTGVLSPVDRDADAARYATSGDWYDRGLQIEGVLERRTGMLNAQRSARVNVEDVWDGFVGTQREVAIADRPVDVEVGLSETPEFDLSVDDVATPTGPRANATDATLGENPHVPRAVEKTLGDDEWGAEGAMTYLYRRDFDVYEINTILSAGALGRGPNRRLVPTRWSITAVDDAVGKYLRGTTRGADTISEVEVWHNDYMGNRYWIVLAPGTWEFELVEMKAPDSVWNPTGETHYLASAHEGHEGRTGYVDETAGAYYAARLGVLEHLAERDRQAKCLVLREVTDAYWAPVGVWQVREGVRHAFDDPAGVIDAIAGRPGQSSTFGNAIDRLVERELPISRAALRRKSTLATGRQAGLEDF